MWTQAVVRWADTVTAVDAAPEMLAQARARVADPQVSYVVADVFGWQAPRRYDTVFFAFWLSHVPPGRFAGFWTRLRGWLAPGGRVLFVDEGPAGVGNEIYPDPAGYVVERRLADGSVHRVVKVFTDPEQLGRRLAEAGWGAAIRRAGPDWLVGEAWCDRARARSDSVARRRRVHRLHGVPARPRDHMGSQNGRTPPCRHQRTGRARSGDTGRGHRGGVLVGYGSHGRRERALGRHTGCFD